MTLLELDSLKPGDLLVTNCDHFVELYSWYEQNGCNKHVNYNDLLARQKLIKEFSFVMFLQFIEQDKVLFLNKKYNFLPKCLVLLSDGKKFICSPLNISFYSYRK